MTSLNKYIKAPVSGSAAQYADNELRKIESSLQTHFSFLEELEFMAAAIETGSFVVTLTGCTTSPQVTVRYARSGNIIVLFIPAITGTSNTTACTLTGVPVALQPSVSQGLFPVPVYDNNTLMFGTALVGNAGTIVLRPSNFNVNGFTASSVKGIEVSNVVYLKE